MTHSGVCCAQLCYLLFFSVKITAGLGGGGNKNNHSIIIRPVPKILAWLPVAFLFFLPGTEFHCLIETPTARCQVRLIVLILKAFPDTPSLPPSSVENPLRPHHPHHSLCSPLSISSSASICGLYLKHFYSHVLLKLPTM